MSNKKIPKGKKNVISDSSSIEDSINEINSDEINISDIQMDDIDLEDNANLIELTSKLITDDSDSDHDMDISDSSSEKDMVSFSEDIVLSKHTLNGKHSLNYDSIFKGKKDELNEEEDIELMPISEVFSVDRTTQYWDESQDNENFIRSKKIKEKIYDTLKEFTDLNFISNRRKPSKVDFNSYYSLLRNKLKGENFSNIELFNELSVYFSDNLFNMFKLLDNKYRNIIISELQTHIGKQKINREIIPRNLNEGVEVEFKWQEDDDVKRITGIIIETNHYEKRYIINSFEKKYDIEIDMITKILNNSKYRYNLNKLNNIDFL